MKNQLLLLEDVDGLGRSGDVVSAKPGFTRNYLLPEKKAIIADKHTLKMQAKLQEERAKRAVIDRKESEELAQKIEGIIVHAKVKVDPEGNMYGSVTTHDIQNLLKAKGHDLDRKMFNLAQPIKALGAHAIPVKLKEGVTTSFTLEVIAEDEHGKIKEVKKES